MEGIKPNSLEFWNSMDAEYKRHNDMRDNPIEYPMIAQNCVGTILEFGPAFGSFTKYLTTEQRSMYVGIEYSPVLLNSAKLIHPEIDFRIGSILNSGLDNDSFDTVVALQILEHFDEQDFFKALWEIKRIARQRIIFSVPNKEMIPDRSHIQIFDYEKVFNVLKVWGEVTFLKGQDHHIIARQDR